MVLLTDPNYTRFLHLMFVNVVFSSSFFPAWNAKCLSVTSCKKPLFNSLITKKLKIVKIFTDLLGHLILKRRGLRIQIMAIHIDHDT